MIAVILILEIATGSPFGLGKIRNFIISLLALFSFFYFFTTAQNLSAFLLLFFLTLSPIFLQVSLGGNIPKKEMTEAIYWSLGWSVLFCSLLSLTYFIFINNRSNPARKQKFLQSIGLILLIFGSALGFIYLGYFVMSRSLLSAETLLAIAQSNTSESISYLKENFDNFANIFSALLLLTLLFTVFYFLLKRSADYLPTEVSKRKISLLIFSSLLSVFLIYKCSYNFVTAPFYGFKVGLKSYKDFQAQVSKRKKLLGTKNCKESGFPGLYVIVIGESQNKNHLSAYGYYRDTTPWLNSSKDRDNFILFGEAFSNHTHTVPALSFALTSKSQYDNLKLEDSLSIVETAKCAGYETYWLSNQVKFGAWDTPITVISSSADHQVFINKNMGTTTNTTFFDGKLVDKLNSIHPSSQKTLLIIHLMGSHSSYIDRYPPNFNIWGNSTKIDLSNDKFKYPTNDKNSDPGVKLNKC